MRTTASKRQSSLALAQAVSRLLDRIHLDEFDLDEVRHLAGQALQGGAERVLGLLKNPLFGHFPGIAPPALGLGCLPRGKSFGARADLFWHGGSGLLALLVHPGRPVFNTLLRHN